MKTPLRPACPGVPARHLRLRDFLSRSLASLRRLAAPPLLLVLLSGSIHAEPENPHTDWFRAARYGVFMHFLPGDERQFSTVNDFDVDFVAEQLHQARAGYLVITLGQNSGWFISPNAAYDRQTGYAAGERCARRDLPADLFAALEPRGIKLMLYLPCQVPNRDPRAQRAFGLPEGSADQPLDLEFAGKWAAVIHEWSARYGPKVAGWWFDGGYAHIDFNEAIAATYAAAVKRGNPEAIVTFNPGVRLIRYTVAEDYTAGELNEPLEVLPRSRRVEGSQWHALTYLGSAWGRRDTRFATSQWVDWARAVVAGEGVLTLDAGPNWDGKEGPIGAISPRQMQQLRAIGVAVSEAPAAKRQP
ncbi:MAG: alpha-L-fucosidase [Verrucomicrobiales bacterium]|nr:alpha-L-fucosidase [Verrucomicrobiales bacterium]